MLGYNLVKRPPLFGQNHIKTATVGHPTNGVFNVASSRQVHFILELWRQKFRNFAIFIPIHFHGIYIGSSSPQTRDNCLPKLTLALWRDVVFLESFYGEFDISREILLIFKKTYSGQGYVTNYAVLVAKTDLF